MTTYYVRTTGNDAAGGTTPATAWRTLNKALGSASTAVSGDIIYAGSGVYREKATLALPAPTSTTLNGAITDSATSLIATSSSGFPTAPFHVKVYDTGAITGITTHASAPVVTSAGHGLTTGRRITIQGVVTAGDNVEGVDFGTAPALVFTATAHAFTVDDYVIITGVVTDAGAQGTWVGVVSAVTANTFTATIASYTGSSYVSGGTITVADPANDTFYVTVINASTFSIDCNRHIAYASGGTWSATLPELIKVTGVVGTTWTIERAQQETVARAHNSGATVETYTLLEADVLGSRTGDDPGEVRLTNYLTDDETAPTYQNLMDLNGRDNLIFKRLSFVFVVMGDDSNPDMIAASSAVSQYIDFLECSVNCVIYNQNQVIVLFRVLGELTTPLHWFMDRCIFSVYGVGPEYAIDIDYQQAHTTNVDADFIINNCRYLGTGGFVRFRGSSLVDLSPASAGGLVLWNNSISTNEIITVMMQNAYTPAVSCKFYNNLIFTGAWYYFIDAGNCSIRTIREDYNLVYGYAGQIYNDNSSVISHGGHSVINGSYAPLIHFGQEIQWLQPQRILMSPLAGSPLLAFGNTQDAPNVDYSNRPRPSGLNGDETMNAVGAYERHDDARAETTIYDSAPACQAIDGPGDHDFEIPVFAEETVITVKVLYNTAHGTTNKPQVQILANPAIGVTGETVTSDGMPDGWAELAFAAFTPTGRGEVILRCISRSESASGIAYFDTITVNGA
jgi:hypothetical protein